MLFREQVARKPNLYPWTTDFIDKIWEGFWTPNEFDFKADYSQFHEMNPAEQEIVVRTLSAIGQIEIAVKTFWAKLGENLPHPCMSDLGFVMANSEVIHNIAYEKLLNKLNLGDVFEENLKLPIISGRVNYLRKYLKQVYSDDKRKQYIYSIILFTLFVENVSLFSQFYVVLWFNRARNVLKDTAQQVQYTRNEEMLHAQVGVTIINTLRHEYPELFDEELEQRIVAETWEAYQCESGIIGWMLSGFSEEEVVDGETCGLSPEILQAYVANRLNDSLSAIGYKPVFQPSNELLAKTQWMHEELMGNNQSDFFFKKPVDYAKNNKVYSEEELF